MNALLCDIVNAGECFHVEFSFLLGTRFLELKFEAIDVFVLGCYHYGLEEKRVTQNE
jgi:glutamate racemase